MSLFSNGTLALLSALQVLRISGEVITTSNSFVATTHTLHWNRIKPIFCDTDDNFGNLNPDKIEELITPNTTAILPVHVYGNPCDIEGIQKIANKYRLKVTYDAAHAFGVKKNNVSILNSGDLSVLSFHATKTFNTIEGRAVICHDEKTKIQLDYLKNFGFANETTVVAPGINAKMNELPAAYGLLQLKEYNKHHQRRKDMIFEYRRLLAGIKGIRMLNQTNDIEHNFSYLPIFVENEYHLTRDELFLKLREHNIYARRYFYPLISSFVTYRDLPSAKSDLLGNAEKLANEVICLPICPNLTNEEVNYICNLIV